MTQCWQQNPEDRPTFFQLVEKLRSHHERMKCASVCIDDDLSDIEEEGELKRGDSNRSVSSTARLVTHDRRMELQHTCHACPTVLYPVHTLYVLPCL